MVFNAWIFTSNFLNKLQTKFAASGRLCLEEFILVRVRASQACFDSEVFLHSFLWALFPFAGLLITNGKVICLPQLVLKLIYGITIGSYLSFVFSYFFQPCKTPNILRQFTSCNQVSAYQQLSVGNRYSNIC